MVLQRKKNQLKAEWFFRLKANHTLKKRQRAVVEYAMKIIKNHNMIKAKIKIVRWKNEALKKTQKLTTGFDALSKLFDVKSSGYVSIGYELIYTHSAKLLNLVVKLERKYELKNEILLKKIMNIEYSRSSEKIVLVTPPAKFNQRLIIKKNGFRYLSILIRKFAWRRESGFFLWYQQKTLIMRNAFFLKDIIDRILKAKGYSQIMIV